MEEKMKNLFEYSKEMYDIIIIGAGPAGISASLYAKRANMNVLVIYKGTSNLENATKIENYYGFPDGITGQDLYNSGIMQAKNLGVDFRVSEVTSIEYQQDCFNVKTPGNEYNAKSVIISTGNKKLKPNIKGINEFEGKGISYCAICDGFFYRNKDVAVIGSGEFAFSEAKMLSNVVKDITILTNGEQIKNAEENKFDENNFKINIKKIKEITGSEKVEKIIFEDLTEIDIDGIFIALGEAGANDFAKTLGIITENDNIKVNENMETNVPGIFACGNITGGLLQVNKAVYEGAKAGLSAVKYVKEIKK